RKVEPEPVTGNSASIDAVTLEAGWHVIVPEPAWIEPIFQRSHRAAVLEHSAIPDTLQRWDLVIPGAASRVHRQIGIRADRDLHDRITSGVVCRDREPRRRQQCVVRVERRRMARRAPLSVKNSLPTAGGPIEAVWIGRRPQGVDEERK